MANTALNRTTQVLLTNKSGGALVYGDVVILDNTNASGFTTTTTAGLSTRGIGVILEPSGIANNASGMVAIGGWCPRINLNTAAAIGQFVKTHTVAGQGTPHASPQVEGDFAVALSASANPPCNLFGSPNGPLAGGAGTVTNTGTLTATKTILGNGGVDVTVSALTAQFVGSTAGVEAAASMTTARLLGRTTASSGAVEEITVGTGLTLSAGSLTSSGGGFVLLEQHTASSSASLDFTTAFTSTYDDYHFEVINVLPATNAVDFFIRMSTNGGSSYDSGANYSYSSTVWSTSAGANAGGTGQTAIGMRGTGETNNSSTQGGIVGVVKIFNPLSASIYKRTEQHLAYYSNAGALIGVESRGMYLSTTAVNAMQFFFGSGNVASGTIRCYGIAK